MPTPRVVAVIPVLNEAGAISNTLQRIPAAVNHAIVVDGGSTDSTVAEARGLGAEVIVEARRGYGLSFRGLRDRLQEHERAA